MANSNQNVETPIEFIHAVEKIFNIKFGYDMAATEENAKCEMYYTEIMDSLVLPWPTERWCWLNPPFRNLTEWVKKCHKEYQRGAKIISVWPLSGDHNQINAWQHSSVHIIHGRVWPEVRSIMLCKWDMSWPGNYVMGLLWKNNELKRLWS